MALIGEGQRDHISTGRSHLLEGGRLVHGAAVAQWLGHQCGADAVHLESEQYWEINSLEITNKKAALGDYRGISINAKNAGTLNVLYVRTCFVHDVS